MATPRFGIWFLKISTLYLLLGLFVGMYLGISKDYSVISAHAHINLLGWMSMALCGFIYIRYGEAISTRSAAIHFWGHNIGLPVMMLSLVAMAKGYTAAAPGISVGALLLVASLTLFTVNVFRGVKLHAS